MRNMDIPIANVILESVIYWNLEQKYYKYSL